MFDNLDEILRDDLVTPADDFSNRVMLRIATLPAPSFPTRASHASEKMQWAALIGASLVGVIQLITFMFGIWTATAAS